MFTESIKNCFTLTFDSCTTERQTDRLGEEFQLDLGSSAMVNSPKNLIAAHQTKGWSGPVNRVNVFFNFW